jgi:hypothetical protein
VESADSVFQALHDDNVKVDSSLRVVFSSVAGVAEIHPWEKDLDCCFLV